MLVALGVTANAEVRAPHATEIETMLVVMTGRAEATAQLTRGRVANELSFSGGLRDESRSAKGRLRGSIMIE
jgi:hypothetical protein